jgi:hypothetical protein
VRVVLSLVPKCEGPGAPGSLRGREILRRGRRKEIRALGFVLLRVFRSFATGKGSGRDVGRRARGGSCGPWG